MEPGFLVPYECATLMNVIFCHRKSLHVTRNDFFRKIDDFFPKIYFFSNRDLLYQLSSCHRKWILVTRNKLLSQELNSFHKKWMLVKRNKCFTARKIVLSLNLPRSTRDYKKRADNKGNFLWQDTNFLSAMLPGWLGL